ncbi:MULTISPECIES: mannonate dehydratase [unclassified Algoriphagus]|jgi:mannonate dehydratase|uniref:mannonate dehydratase n=2 Tax=Algoriphagus TaxID=246875 RepID=UPI00257D2831|nr:MULTISPECIES: mannonate dehydratase [unclassified Algoriphagus]|tara:strand:- start:5261 stop:6439 length:1179 start_codon:yes stop_codon:yes gene_type:complete
MALFKMEQTMRWYGPNDPVSLRDIRQAGATGIVTALHHIPNGDIWSREEIQLRKKTIEDAGLNWSVVESVPVHERIKTRSGNFQELVANYQQTIRNLASEGIFTVCYNFMPILDWTRTDLERELPNGSKALFYEKKAVQAFDLFILKRHAALEEYTPKEIEEVRKYYEVLSPEKKQLIIDNILKGLPGSEIGYTLDEFREMLSTYEGINAPKLQEHLRLFLDALVPVAEEVGVYMTIHPDDPPFSLYGLPRVVSTAADARRIIRDNPSPHNGLCFCTGSYGVRPDNDLPAMVAEFGDHINFIHLRSTKRDEGGNFFEDNHLEGDVPMVAVIDEILKIQEKRGKSIPMRPDHGHQMLDDLGKKTNPGYSAIGRLKGLAEIRGVEQALLYSKTK